MKNKYTIKRILMYAAIAAFAVFIALSFSSCNKEGEILDQSTKGVIINGKEYKFIRIVPTEGASAVWILVPKDARVEVPSTIAWKVSCGKNCTKMVSAILIPS